MSLFDAVDTEEFLRTVFPEENPYLKDPVGWVRDVLGESMWSKQAEICESVVHNPHTAVQSAHGVGKSWVASRIIAWWLAVHPPGSAFVVSTAPTYKQVHAVLWRYLGQIHRKAGLDGHITMKDEWYIGPKGNEKELVAFGSKPADYDPTAFQGQHATYMLVVYDEGCGIPFTIYDAGDSMASNKHSRSLAIGNPTDPSAHFAKMCAPGSHWNRLKISAYDSPVFTGESVPEEMLTNLVDSDWVERKAKEYGLSSPMYAARVLGEFPEISDDSLIQPKWVEAAQEREIERNGEPKLGVDVARMGEDETVAFLREGGWARVVWSAHKQSTMVTAGHVVKLIDEINTERPWNEGVVAQIDADGLGAGVYDRLIELGYDVAEYRGGMPAIDSDRFANRRAECYWMLKEMFEAGEIDIDPDDDVLASQLQSLKWTLTSKGQIKIESKEDMRKRGMPSPDRADALMQSCAADYLLMPEQPPTNKPTSITGDLLNIKWG